VHFVFRGKKISCPQKIKAPMKKATETPPEPLVECYFPWLCTDVKSGDKEDNAISRVVTAAAIGALIALAYYFVAAPTPPITKKTHLVLVDSRLWEQSHKEIKEQAKPGVIVQYMGGPGDIPMFLSTLTDQEKAEIASISVLFHGSPSDAGGKPISGDNVDLAENTVSIEILRAEISVREDDIRTMTVVIDPNDVKRSTAVVAASMLAYPRFWELRKAMGLLYTATETQKAPFFLYACNLASIPGFKKLFNGFGRAIYGSTDVTGASNDGKGKNWTMEWCTDEDAIPDHVANHAVNNLFWDPNKLPLTLGAVDLAEMDLRAKSGEEVTRPAALAEALNGATYAAPGDEEASMSIGDVIRTEGVLNSGRYALLAIYIAGSARFGLKKDHAVLDACSLASGIPVVVCGVDSVAAKALVTETTVDTKFYVPDEAAAKQIIAAIDFDGRFHPNKRLAIVLFDTECSSVDVLVLDALQESVGDPLVQALHAALASAPLARWNNGRAEPVEFEDIATRRAADVEESLCDARDDLQERIRSIMQDVAQQPLSKHIETRRSKLLTKGITDTIVDLAGAAATAAYNVPVGLRPIAVYVSSLPCDKGTVEKLEQLYNGDMDSDSFEVVFINGDDALMTDQDYSIDSDGYRPPWPWVDHTSKEGRESIRVLRGVINALVGSTDALLLLDVSDPARPTYSLRVIPTPDSDDLDGLSDSLRTFRGTCASKNIKPSRKKRHVVQVELDA
jgi:hypothetical protein